MLRHLVSCYYYDYGCLITQPYTMGQYHGDGKGIQNNQKGVTARCTRVVRRAVTVSYLPYQLPYLERKVVRHAAVARVFNGHSAVPRHLLTTTDDKGATDNEPKTNGHRKGICSPQYSGGAKYFRVAHFISSVCFP